MAFRGDDHAVRTAFMAGYHAPGSREARFLRQLACIPPEFKTGDGYVTSDVAAAASGLSSDDVRAVTEELQSLSLVRRREGGEYALYDECSAIFPELAGANSPEERDAAANRLEAWQGNNEIERSA
jgi:hypothetical protein